MKRNLLFLILFALAAPAFSQNWAPINATEKFCYSSDDTLEIINNVLWAESFEQNGGEQLYQLNKIAKPVENQDFMYLFNEPQFLLDEIIVSESGEWTCLDTFFTPLDTLQSFVLIPNAALNTSWEFSEEMQAEITSIGMMDVLGETDSVKTITLSDESEILLSKEHGIVNWRSQYQLIGIEGRDLGVIVPDFDDMYADISAGDVVCFNSGRWQADGSVEGFIKDSRMDITNVVRYDDSIVISAHVTSNTYNYRKSDILKSTKSYKDLVFYRNRFTDVYPNDTLWAGWPYTMNEGIIVSKLSTHNWGGIKKSQVLVLNEYFENSSIFWPCEGLYSYELCMNDYSDYLVIEPSVRFGFIEYDNSGFEWGGHNELIGIIDNGDTLGSIYPLDMFVGTTQLSQETNWLVYPNPTKNQINLYSSQTGVITYQIFNYSGILIEEQTINKTHNEMSVSLDEFSSGVYLIKLIQNNHTEVLKFLKE